MSERDARSRPRDFDVVGPTRHLQPPADPPDVEAAGEAEGAEEVPPTAAGQASPGQEPPDTAPEGPEAARRSLAGSGPGPETAGRGPGPDSEEPGPEPAETGPVAGPEAEAGILDLFYGVLFDPVRTMRTFRQRTPYGAAFLSFMVASLVSTWLLAGALPALLAARQLTFDTALIPGLVVASVAFGFFAWVAAAAIFHLVADFLGGQGRPRSLFVALGFAYLPRIFNAPVALLDQTIGLDLGFLALAISIWVVYLFFVAIREVEGLDTLPALAVLVSPLLVLLGFLVMLVMLLLLVGGTVAPFLEGLGGGS